jgi:radical SAM superfamily enzyme YgiQ (UPF0313 family)
VKTFLVNLPWREGSRLGVRAGSRWPFTTKPQNDGRLRYVPFPFFLAYAAALLKKAGQDMFLLDAIAEGISASRVIDNIRAFGPDLLVTETSTPSLKNDLEILRCIRREVPHCQIALAAVPGGAATRPLLEECDVCDYLLIGEYEETLLDLVRHLEEDPAALASVPGIAYRENGVVRVNPRRRSIESLDALPWPYRETLPMDKYNDAFCHLPEPNAQMWASRGCPFTCAFCLWPQTIYGEHRYRKRNSEDVVNEMEFLVRKYGFKAVYFDDDIFNADRDHCLDICRVLRKRALDVPWAVMARADLMDEDVLRAMAGSGLYAVKYGIESANLAILDGINKNMDLDRSVRVIKMSQKLNVKVHLTFCLGLPGETAATLEETARFIENVMPVSTQFSYATPFPGTRYFELVKQSGYLLSDEGSDYDGAQKCVVRTQELGREDLLEARRRLEERFKIA